MRVFLQEVGGMILVAATLSILIGLVLVFSFLIYWGGSWFTAIVPWPNG